jgi:hypothetical protein
MPAASTAGADRRDDRFQVSCAVIRDFPTVTDIEAYKKIKNA